MITAKFNANTGYILKGRRQEPIAVITHNTNDDNLDITDKVSLALEEHFATDRSVKIVSDIKLSTGDDIVEFDAILDGEEDTFYFQHTTLY